MDETLRVEESKKPFGLEFLERIITDAEIPFGAAAQTTTMVTSTCGFKPCDHRADAD